METNTETELHSHHAPMKISKTNPDVCTGGHKCAHPADHVHGKGCGHEQVAHGNHFDYIVGNHLHHFHKGHCDNHGAIH